MLNTQILFKDRNYPLSFFDDDTIETVQQQISRSIDVHPDRLYILVGLKLPRTYYKQDPRNWETLFNRISLDGKPIEKELFNAYCHELHSPVINMKFKAYDKDEWMQTDDLDELKDPNGEFVEYRILGVDKLLSFTLPLKFNAIANRIPSASFPIPQLSTIFSTLYKYEVTGFIVKEHEDYEGPYFPLLRKTSPQRLSEGEILSLESNTKHLKDLLSLDPPAPASTHVLRVSWRIDLVDTSFGDAVQTRFEQIFYGLTLSEDVPVITFFTPKNEISRHKFYRELKKDKPFIDMPMWMHWVYKSRTSRDKYPIMTLYYGKSRDHFNRITISPHDIIFAAYRDSTNEDSIDSLKRELMDWFLKFDSIIPFVRSEDYAACRFELQEVKYEAKYKETLKKLDTSRLDCLTGIFEENKKIQTEFKFLRTDNTKDDINPRDLKLINMIKMNPFIKEEEVEAELRINYYEASRILGDIKQRIEENPDLLKKEFSKFPKIIFKDDQTIVVSFVKLLDKSLQYCNLLRYILSNPESKVVDKICPRKMEVSSVIVPAVGLDTDDSDLFDYLEEEVVQEEVPRTINSDTLYSYFISRLRKFDPKTFVTASNYPKKCEKSYQPVVLSDEDLANISGTAYDPEKYPENEKLKVQDPGGMYICPEYWCMTDEIPLRESQLKEVGGEKVCPVCSGKIRDEKNTKSDIGEYSVLKRKTGYKHPKLKDDVISPDNGKPLPCCFITPPKTKKIKADNEGKYYIMNEDKVDVGSFRLAYVTKQLLRSLYIDESYDLFKVGNRIAAGTSGFFRIGIERPSVDLPEILKISKKVISPRLMIDCIMRCMFVSTWTKLSDKYSEEIEKKLTIENENARKTLSKILSSISEHFEENKLDQLQELEYTAVVLKLDLYNIMVETNTITCSFYTPQSKLRTNGIIILRFGGKINILSHVIRTSKSFVYQANIFEKPFIDRTVEELISLRNKACDTEAPSYPRVRKFLSDNNITDFSIVMDPFGRAQAVYIPGKLIMPFESITIAPTKKKLLSGYHQVKELPSYQTMRDIMKKFGYIYQQDIHDDKGNIVEIMTSTGFRIPIKPIKGDGPNSAVVGTIMNEDEGDITFGKPNQKDVDTYKKISYNAEIHDFLLFQLSKDLEDESELKEALVLPRRNILEKELGSWFEKITHFFTPDKPIEFLSKIRKPCGQLKKNVCDTAHMCAWSENKCKIAIRDVFSKDKVFNKLLSTLMDNSKIRALVLTGRITPFFSTILYLELPNEIIMTDKEVKEILSKNND